VRPFAIPPGLLGMQGFGIIVYGLMPEHRHRLVWRGQLPNASQVMRAPSQRTGNLTLHRSMGVGVPTDTTMYAPRAGLGQNV
jgi:hypothetical protein